MLCKISSVLKNTCSSTSYLYSPKTPSLNHIIIFFPPRKTSFSCFLNFVQGTPVESASLRQGARKPGLKGAQVPHTGSKMGPFCNTRLFSRSLPEDPCSPSFPARPCPASALRQLKVTFRTRRLLHTLVSNLEMILAGAPPMGSRREFGFCLGAHQD